MFLDSLTVQVINERILFPEFFPRSFQDPMTGKVGLYFEATSVIVTLVLLGQVLELKARGQTSAQEGQADQRERRRLGDLQAKVVDTHVP